MLWRSASSLLVGGVDEVGLVWGAVCEGLVRSPRVVGLPEHGGLDGQAVAVGNCPESRRWRDFDLATGRGAGGGNAHRGMVVRFVRRRSTSCWS